MALLRLWILQAVFLAACPAWAHNMGRPVPIGYVGAGGVPLEAQVVASYFQEMMGRDTELVPAGSAQECLHSVREGRYPMAVLPAAAAAGPLPGLTVMEGALGHPRARVVLVVGRKALQRLEMSLVPAYVTKLSRGLGPQNWEKALEAVEKGRGVRGAALEMLRKADLL